MAKNIVLIGLMGSGKTTVGKMIADELGYAFVDTDIIIEDLSKLTINEIFAQFGEDYFRELEIKVAEELSKQENLVIATGGGIVERIENLDNLGQNGSIFYLYAPPEELFGRIKHTRNRPLLNNQYPERTLHQLIEKREKYYNLADVKIDTVNKTPCEIAKEIMKFLTSTEMEIMNTETVKVEFKKASEKNYPIIIEENILSKTGSLIKQYTKAAKVLVVTNTTVFGLYGTQLGQALKSENIEYSFVILEDGEKHKNTSSLDQIWNKAIEAKLERKDAIIALGGGVVGDIAGFAASTYLRGIDFVQIPTTLLAQVDSSVGGKVAINHSYGKNLLGSFYQPKVVIADLKTLRTLSIEQLKVGLAEILKYGFIEKSCKLDDTYLNLIEYLKDNKDKIFQFNRKALKTLVKYSCMLKAAVVTQDEKELGLRAILNFGHTIGHAVEKCTNYEMFDHGQAVAIGMIGAFYIAFDKGLIDEDYMDSSINLIKLYELDFKIPQQISQTELLEAMLLDKKVLSNKIRFVLPVKETEVEVFNDIEDSTIQSAVGKLY